MDYEDDLAEAGVRRGGGKWVLILLGLAALGGGAYGAYAFWWAPEQQRLARLEQKADADAKVKSGEEATAKAKGDTERLNKEKADEAARIAAAAKPAVGTPDAGGPAKKEPPHDYDYYMARGDRLRESDRAEAALDAYGKASDLEADRSEAVAGKGLALLDMGQPLQAEAAFRQALSLNPRYGVAIMGLAETYRSMGKKADAVEYYQKYLDELPDGPEVSVAKNAIQKLKQ
jgi:tetratricopeptide (TPR) repeat protein